MSGKTITTEWKLPLGHVVSLLAVCAYGTLLYSKMATKLDNAVTTQQAQEWIDNAREANPGVKWPRLPSKLPEQSQVDMILSRKE